MRCPSPTTFARPARPESGGFSRHSQKQDTDRLPNRTSAAQTTPNRARSRASKIASWYSQSSRAGHRSNRRGWYLDRPRGVGARSRGPRARCRPQRITKPGGSPVSQILHLPPVEWRGSYVMVPLGVLAIGRGFRPARDEVITGLAKEGYSGSPNDVPTITDVDLVE